MSKILIVEDEAQIARFVELELIHEGNSVDKAEDGREGLDKALSEDFDLILLDVMLPGINGFEVLRRIRARKDTPVILLTARDATNLFASGMAATTRTVNHFPMALQFIARLQGDANFIIEQSQRDDLAWDKQLLRKFNDAIMGTDYILSSKLSELPLVTTRKI